MGNEITDVLCRCSEMTDAMLKDALDMLRCGCVTYSEIERKIETLKNVEAYGDEMTRVGSVNYLSLVGRIREILEKEKDNLYRADCH